MLPSLSRRTLLVAVAGGASAIVAGCSSDQQTPTETPLPTPAPSPGEPRGRLPGSLTSEVFGPTGTHWPGSTPFPYPDLASMDVACTWDSIRDAISAVTDEQASAGIQLLVAPGTLRGTKGREVLRELGRPDWKRNVLVIPRDGWGSVTMTGETRMSKVQGITFARFNGDFVGLKDCSRTVWAQSKVSSGLRIYAETEDVTQCDVYEVVMTNAQVTDQDPFAYTAGEGVSVRDSSWVGCYGAPAFRRAGSRAHLDTFQMFGKGFYRGLVLKDTVLFGSHNCAVQLGGVQDNDPHAGSPFLTLDHSLLVCQNVAAATRYPAPPEAELPPIDQAINGAGEPSQLHAFRSVVLGTLYRTEWGEVEESYTSAEQAVEGNPAKNGSWQYDPTLANLTEEMLQDYAPIPDDEFLAQIWR